MADIQYTKTGPSILLDKITWETLTSANAAGTAYGPSGTRAAVATLQAFGTFDSATLVLQGSNDGTNWETLSDTNGTAISLAAAVDGVALTDNTTPTALADLSANDVQVGYDFNGTIKLLRAWPENLTEAGREGASA